MISCFCLATVCATSVQLVRFVWCGAVRCGPVWSGAAAAAAAAHTHTHTRCTLPDNTNVARPLPNVYKLNSNDLNQFVQFAFYYAVLMAQAQIDQAFKCKYCNDEYFYTLKSYQKHLNRQHFVRRETTVTWTVVLCPACASQLTLDKTNSINVSLCDICLQRNFRRDGC